MRIHILHIPAPADWINANDRLHWAPKAKLTKAWRQAGAVHARASKLPKGLRHVTIAATVTKPTRQAYDAHNLTPTAKAVIDGLVDYGLVPDDTNTYVTGPDMRASKSIGPATLTLTIQEQP